MPGSRPKCFQAAALGSLSRLLQGPMVIVGIRPLGVGIFQTGRRKYKLGPPTTRPGKKFLVQIFASLARVYNTVYIF